MTRLQRSTPDRKSLAWSGSEWITTDFSPLFLSQNCETVTEMWGDRLSDPEPHAGDRTPPSPQSTRPLRIKTSAMRLKYSHRALRQCIAQRIELAVLLIGLSSSRQCIGGIRSSLWASSVSLPLAVATAVRKLRVDKQVDGELYGHETHLGFIWRHNIPICAIHCLPQILQRRVT